MSGLCLGALCGVGSLQRLETRPKTKTGPGQRGPPPSGAALTAGGWGHGRGHGWGHSRGHGPEERMSCLAPASGGGVPGKRPVPLRSRNGGLDRPQGTWRSARGRYPTYTTSQVPACPNTRARPHTH